MKQACARVGAVTALSRAKAWLPELDPTDISTGYPSLKEHVTSFSKKDFANCVKMIHPLASLIASETDLSKYEPSYDLENQKMPTPSYKVHYLIPPVRKHTFTPEVDPDELIDNEEEFQALSGIDRESPTFQEMKKTKTRSGMIQKHQANKIKKIDLQGGSYL